MSRNTILVDGVHALGTDSLNPSPPNKFEKNLKASAPRQQL